MTKFRKYLFDFFVRNKFKAEEGIVIFSEARGGSTWLMEILNNIPNTVVDWEPLHVNNGVVPVDFRWVGTPIYPKMIKIWNILS